MVIKVLTEAELHRMGVEAKNGYSIVEIDDQWRPSASNQKPPTPDLLAGPYPAESLARHIAQTKYGATNP